MGDFNVTIPTAAAGRLSNHRSAVFGLLLTSSLGLAGCESGFSVVGNNSGAQPETQLAQPAPAPAPQTRVSVAPVIGAPDGVAKQLQQDFSTAIGQKSVTVVGAQDKADYALRGYIVAAKEKAGTKVSYIWDVTDPAGRRVNRITGEEIVAGAAGTDAWSGVTAPVSQSIAQKSAGSFATWLQQANAPAAVASAPPAAGSAPIGVGAVEPTSVASIPAAVPAVTPAPQRIAAVAPPAASKEPLAAVVPSLVGAPGDGNSALAKALQSELTKSGVATAGQSASSYRVEGVVKVGQSADGKQPVQIDWNVKDPQGKRLGTVTQKNEIPAGSLDSSWGKTADAAASAAAQGILKLLPKSSAN